MSDKEHLKWMYNKLSKIHGEHIGFDYMIKFKKIIDNYNVPQLIGFEEFWVLDEDGKLDRMEEADGK